MLRVWVCILVSFTVLVVGHLIAQDVTSGDTKADGRFKRQTTEMNTTDNNRTHPGPHHKFQCCKKMPRMIDRDIMKQCMGPRHGPHGPPPGSDGGPPPPPPGSDGGPPPPGGNGGPPPPPPDDDGPPPPPPEGDNSASSEYGTEGSDAEPSANTPGQGAHQRRGHGKGKVREHSGCFMECVFGKINAIKDGALDNKVLEDYVVNKFKDNPEDPWKNVVLDAFKKCSSTDTTTVKQEQKCKSGAAEMTKCMYKEMFKNCPEGNWKSTEECNACRDSGDKCRFKKGDKWKGKGKQE